MTQRKPLFFNYDEGISQEFDATSDTVAFAQVSLTGLNGIGLNAQGQRIAGLASPSDPLDATNKAYVDSVAQGLNVKIAVLAATENNVASLSGTGTIDGQAVAIGSRVLLMGQSNGTQNGIWVVQSGNWVRPTDFSSGSHAASAFCFVESGSTFADNGFTCTTDAPNDVIDVNPLLFTQFTGAGEIITGAGLTKSGNNLAVTIAAASGLQFTSGALDTYLTATGGLAKDANGLRALIKAGGTTSATLQSDATGLSVLGLPNLFTVAGAATTANVSAANLNTLTMGVTAQADALHTHANVISAKVVGDSHTTGTALSAGDPVAWGSTANTLVRGDAGVDAQARIIGLAFTATAANAAGIIVKRGVLKNVLSGATPGQAFYLAIGGGLTPTIPTGASIRLVRVGFAVNATDLDVAIHDMGKRSA